MRLQQGARWIAGVGLFVSSVVFPRTVLAGEDQGLADDFFAMRPVAWPAAAPFAEGSLADGGAGEAGEIPAWSPSPAGSASLQPVTIGIPRSVTGSSSGRPLFTIAGVGLFATAAGDLLTTEMGLARQGVYEQNPVQGNRLVRVGTHVAVPALLWWMTERAHDRGKAKLALAMRIGFAVAYGYVTLHNTRLLGSTP